MQSDAVRELKFRDPARGAALAAKLQRTVVEIGRSPVLRAAAKKRGAPYTPSRSASASVS